MLFIVPGNHDLKRICEKKCAGHDGVKKYYKNDKDVIEGFWGKDSSYNQPFWTCVFKDYLEGLSRIYPETGFSKPIFQSHDGLLPGDFLARIPADGFGNIGIIGLNTAALHFSEQAKSYLDIKLEQLQRLLCNQSDDATYDQWFKNNELNLFMTHHPSEWLSDYGKDQYKSIINVGKIHIHLFGHQHGNTITKIEDESCVYLQASSLFGEEYWYDGTSQNPVKNPRSHGFTAGVITKNEQEINLRIWPTKGIKQNNGKWTFVYDEHLNDKKSVISEGPYDKTDGGTKPIVLLKLTSGTKGGGDSVGKFTPSIDSKEITTNNKNSQRLQQNVSSELSKSTEIADCLFGLLTSKGYTGRNESGSMAQALFTWSEDPYDINSQAIGIFVDLLEYFNTQYKADEEKYLTIWNRVQEIVGWLLLLLVDEKWLDEEGLLDVKLKLTIKVKSSLKTYGAQNVLFSRIVMKSSKPFKRHWLLDNEKIDRLESGWSDKQRIEDLLTIIWNHYDLRDGEKIEAPQKFDERILDKIRGRIDAEKGRNVPVYLPVKENGCEQIMQELAKKLDNLPIMLVESTEKTKQLIISEEKLDGMLGGLFSLMPENRSKKNVNR